MAVYNTWDLRAEFAPEGEPQRESKVDGFGRGGSLVTEDGESVLTGDVDRLIITDGDDDHPQGRFVIAQVNWQSSPSEQAANAKLLLAAPAMLAALKTAVELLGRVDSADPICDDWRTEISMSEIQDAIKAATFVANV